MHKQKTPLTKDWNTVVWIGAHLITLNLVMAILVGLYFLIVEKTRHEGPIPASWTGRTVDPE